MFGAGNCEGKERPPRVDIDALIRDTDLNQDRKSMIKALKPVAPQLAVNETGYLVLLAIFEVVDDTVLVSKSLLLELQQNILSLATDKFGRIPLLYPFAGRKPRLLPPSALPILQELDELRQATRYIWTLCNSPSTNTDNTPSHAVKKIPRLGKLS